MKMDFAFMKLIIKDKGRENEKKYKNSGLDSLLQ